LLKVGPKGRVVIPAPIRRQLGLHEGRELIAVLEDDGVLLLPRAAIRKQLRSLFRDMPSSLADELIAERRAAALEESRER
jgi:AbrB family looped-hinge helix DNA binding protein